LSTLTRAALEARLAALPGLTVTLFGDYSLDAYWILRPDTGQISIETGQPVREVAEQRYGLGAVGNAATAVRTLGVGTVRTIGVIGEDPFGRRTLQEMDAQGMDRTGMVVLPPPWETLVYAKPYVGADEQPRFDFGSLGALPDGVAQRLADLFDEAARTSDAVIVNQQIRTGLYTPYLIERIAAAMAANPGTVFVVDTRDLGVPFPHAALKLNCHEATSFFGEQPVEDVPDDEAMALAAKIAASTGSAVFLTRGANGVVVAAGDEVEHVLPVDTGPKVDTVGAGDAATAAIAAVLGAGGSAVEAAQVANLAASITVRVLKATGTDAVTPAAVLAALDDDVVYAPGLAADPTRARFVEGTEFELVEPLPRAGFSHVIFDHDGTLSTLREGWEGVMAPMMLEAVLGPAYGHTGAAVVDEVRAQVADLIDRTTGIQTLIQMQGLVELVREWGFVPAGQVLDEHGYKAIYNELLLDRVRVRIEKVRSGQLTREDFHLKNALPLLRALRDAGLVLHLASGTDEADVVAEANELGFGEFFGDRIYGSIGVVEHDAKKVVIERILRENHLDGAQLLTFGDGPVEMRETRKRGGVAIGVCSDEVRRYGFNAAKRRRLIRGGAHLLIPDYSDLPSLLRAIGIGQPAAR
jgi:bifunctional ADP-heptose synthase (sugar kinase/adenylyltransferase)/phosphoglycolate phosphatase-like HAD superfamily hydrolase